MWFIPNFCYVVYSILNLYFSATVTFHIIDILTIICYEYFSVLSRVLSIFNFNVIHNQTSLFMTTNAPVIGWRLPPCTKDNDISPFEPFTFYQGQCDQFSLYCKNNVHGKKISFQKGFFNLLIYVWMIRLYSVMI